MRLLGDEGCLLWVKFNLRFAQLNRGRRAGPSAVVTIRRACPVKPTRAAHGFRKSWLPSKKKTCTVVLQAASLRGRRTCAEDNGTPPISIASCTASSVTCAVLSVASGNSTCHAETLVPENQTAGLPPYSRLESIAAAIYEEKQMTVEDLHLKRVLHERAQPIVRLAAIDWRCVEIDLRAAGQVEH